MKIQVQAIAVSFLLAKPRSVVVVINKTSSIWRTAVMRTPCSFSWGTCKGERAQEV